MSVTTCKITEVFKGHPESIKAQKYQFYGYFRSTITNLK